MQASLLENPEETPKPKRPNTALKILRIGWPIMFMRMAGQVRGLLTYWLLNHQSAGTHDSTQVAAFSLADLWCRVTGLCFIFGLGGGLDTFASQAWGAKEHKKLGLQVFRAFLLLTLVINGPIIVFWLFAEDILTAAGQDAAVAKLVGVYARIAIPGQCCLTLTCVLTKMLTAMGKTGKMLMINLFFTAVGIGLTYLAVQALNLGVFGAAVVSSSLQIMQALVYLGVVARDADCRKCWPGLTIRAFQGWWPYLKIALPCFLMGVCEWWSWDLVTFLAGECHTVTGHPHIFGGNLTDTPREILAAQGLMQQVLSTSYVLATGVGRGTGTVVGNSLGAGDHIGAAHACRIGVLMGCAAMGIGSAGLILLRDDWRYIFRADPGLTNIMRVMIWWVAGFGFEDGVQTVLAAVIIGAGKQAVTVPLLIVAYWILGLPLGGVAALEPHFNYGLLGIWWGMLLGVTIHCGYFVLLCFCPCMPGAIRWREAAEAAARRVAAVGEEEGPPTDGGAINDAATSPLDAQQAVDADGEQRER